MGPVVNQIKRHKWTAVVFGLYCLCWLGFLIIFLLPRKTLHTTVQQPDGPGNISAAFFVIGSLASGLYGLIVTMLAIGNKAQPNIYWWLLLAVVLVPVLVVTCIFLAASS